MSRWWSVAAAALLLMAVVVAAALAVAWVALPLESTTITIDGESFSLGRLSGGQTAAAFAIAVVVVLLSLFVGVLAVAIGLVVAALGIGVGVLATVGSLALVASPFLLVGWLVWLAVRRPRSAASTSVTA